MPRTRSLAWSELKIGILAVAALVLAAMLIFAVGGQGGFSWQRYELKTKFPNVQGLKVGRRRPGRRRRRRPGHGGGFRRRRRAGDARKSNNENRARITDQSRASIGSLSLLGEPIIEISPSAQGTPLKDGDFIQSARTPGQIADVAEKRRETLEQATGLIKEIRAGKGTVGKLFTDDQMYKRAEPVRRVRAGGGDRRSSSGSGSLGMLIKDPGRLPARPMPRSPTCRTMTRRINAGEGSLGKLLNDEAARKVADARRHERSTRSPAVCSAAKAPPASC